MNFKFSLLADIAAQNNAHLQGVKRVFINNADTDSALTQFAYGVMQRSQQSGVHAHATMDEYFYFIKGKGIYLIEDSSIQLIPGSFVCIPAGLKHNLLNNHKADLEFVYFGIAV